MSKPGRFIYVLFVKQRSIKMEKKTHENQNLKFYGLLLSVYIYQ